MVNKYAYHIERQTEGVVRWVRYKTYQRRSDVTKWINKVAGPSLRKWDTRYEDRTRIRVEKNGESYLTLTPMEYVMLGAVDTHKWIEEVIWIRAVIGQAEAKKLPDLIQT